MVYRTGTLITIALVSLIGCSGGQPAQGPFVLLGPFAPSSGSSDLTLTCPANQRVVARDTETTVTWDDPAVQNGTGDVAVACAPASGTGFALGETAVQCGARDAAQATAICSFTVTVVPALTISCPADRTVVGNSALTRVTWSAPLTENATDELSVSCVPPSGSTFKPGKKTVTCMARDTLEQSVSCRFTVTVKVPRITKTRFLAFGDSITEGYLRDKPQTYIVPNLTYPGQLTTVLQHKYPAQTVTVVNAGLGGETAPEGRRRLPSVLSQEKPEVLLLLEGYNQITRIAPSSIESALREMIDEAQRRNIFVFLATLTPVTPEKEKERPGHVSAIRAVNEKIRSLASQMNVPLVDLHRALDGRWSLFGSDGVHPNPDGYGVIADTFFDPIVQRFNGPPALLPEFDEFMITDDEPTAPPESFQLIPRSLAEPFPVVRPGVGASDGPLADRPFQRRDDAIN